MKTLVKNNVSIMILPDEVPVKVGEIIEIGDPVKVKINNKDNAVTLYQNVIPPQNYQGKRYCYDGKTWSVNYDWRNEELTAAKR